MITSLNTLNVEDNRRKVTKQWLTKKNRYKRDKYGHILGEEETNKTGDAPVPTANAFAALTQDLQIEENKGNDTEKEGGKEKQSTKEWVMNSSQEIQMIMKIQPINNN